MEKTFICLRDIPDALIPFINNKSKSEATAWYNGVEIVHIRWRWTPPSTAKFCITTVTGYHRVDNALIEIMY